MNAQSVTAVTGATGFLGSRIARALAEAGRPQALIVRDASRAPRLAGASVRQAEYGDSLAARAALEGVGTLFMVSGGEDPRRQQNQLDFIRAAARAGVEHVVYLSFLTTTPDSRFTYARVHHATEKAIVDSGMAHTFLRPNIYMDIVPYWINSAGVLAAPAGNGRVSLISRRDICEVASRIMLDPGPWRGRAIHLTGPQSLSFHDIVVTISEATGRPARYVPQSEEEAYEARRAFAMDELELEASVSTFTAIAAGEFGQVYPDVEEITGHRATSLREFFTR